MKTHTQKGFVTDSKTSKTLRDLYTEVLSIPEQIGKDIGSRFVSGIVWYPRVIYVELTNKNLLI